MAVLVNHYLNAHLTRDYAGYANGIIALFFVLSGYGLSFSLAKIDDFSWRSIKVFYIKRLLRIYPLYWFALLCAALFTHKFYSIATIIASPLHKASGIYWFISSLMQCYLAAPFLYRLLHKKGLPIYLALVLSGAAVLQIIFFAPILPFSPDDFVYRDFFLGHLLLFSLGLCLPALLERYPGRSGYNGALLTVAFFIFVGSVWATRPASPLPSQNALLIAPFFIFACCLFIYSTLNTPMNFPGKKALTIIGDHSYSLYLLHLFYFALLQKIGLIQHNNLKSVLLTIALFPGLILFCIVLENKTNSLVDRLQEKWLQMI